MEDPAKRITLSVSIQLLLIADGNEIARAGDMCKKLITRNDFEETSHTSSSIAGCSGVSPRATLVSKGA